MTTDIVINDRTKFQEHVTALTGLQDQIDTAAQSGQKLTDTLTAVAGKGVAPAAGSASTSSDTVIAPAYAQTLSDINDAITKLNTMITAAKTSTGNVASDLQSVLTGTTNIDAHGAAQNASR